MRLECPTCRQIRCSRCYVQLWADAAVRCTSAQLAGALMGIRSSRSKRHIYHDPPPAGVARRAYHCRRTRSAASGRRSSKHRIQLHAIAMTRTYASNCDGAGHTCAHTPPTFVHPPHAQCPAVHAQCRTCGSAACTYVYLRPRILYTPLWSPLSCSCTAGSSTGQWRWVQEDVSACLDRSGDLAVRIDDFPSAARPAT